MARRIEFAPSWGKDPSREVRRTARVGGPVSARLLPCCASRCMARPYPKRRSARVRGTLAPKRRAARPRGRHPREGPWWPDRRSNLVAAQALARARRFCSFFFRAARMRAVFLRRLGARCLAGIEASYPFRASFWAARPRSPRLRPAGLGRSGHTLWLENRTNHQDYKGGLNPLQESPGGRVMRSGRTSLSNSAAVRYPSATAASRSVVPSRCAFLAISAARS